MYPLFFFFFFFLLFSSDGTIKEWFFFLPSALKIKIYEGFEVNQGDATSSRFLSSAIYHGVHISGETEILLQSQNRTHQNPLDYIFYVKISAVYMPYMLASQPAYFLLLPTNLTINHQLIWGGIIIK